MLTHYSLTSPLITDMIKAQKFNDFKKKKKKTIKLLGVVA